MQPHGLLSDKLLSRNVLHNLLGYGLPLLAGIIAMPFLVALLGAERFGVLAILWMLIGYLGCFDLGLGRALTKFVAERLGRDEHESIPGLIVTTLIAMAAMGTGAATLLYMLAPWIMGAILQVPNALYTEVLAATHWLAVSIPFVITSSALVGVLQAYQRFDKVSVVRGLLGTSNFVAPILALQVDDSLSSVAATLVAARILAWGAWGAMTWNLLPTGSSRTVLSWQLMKPIVSFGGWLTVSSVLGPLLVYMDRFVVGSVLSLSAVAYYTVPFDVVAKIWVIPDAIVSVVFPALVVSLQVGTNHVRELVEKCGTVILFAVFPAALTIVLFAEEGLAFWLGSEFAENSAMVMRVLAIGVFINTISFVPFNLIQSCGRADRTALVHVLQVPMYLVLLWMLVGEWGILGAAVSWALRASSDTAVFMLMASRMVKEVSGAFRRLFVTACLLLSALLVALFIGGTVWKTIFLLCAILPLATRLRSRVRRAGTHRLQATAVAQ